MTPRRKWPGCSASRIRADILPPNASDLARQALASGQKKAERGDSPSAAGPFPGPSFPSSASQVVHCYGVDITEMAESRGPVPPRAKNGIHRPARRRRRP